MTPAALALVVIAAGMHVGWNALTKRSKSAFLFLWLSMLLSSLVLAVPAAWIVARHGISASGVPYAVASMAVHAVYFFALSQAYRLGDLSQVYPVARGLGVALVAVLAVPVLGEEPTVSGAIGIAAVIAGVLAVGLARPAGAGNPVARPRARAARGWAVMTGVMIASYSMVDKVGTGSIDPLPYTVALAFGACVLLIPAVASRRAELAAEWRANARTIGFAALLSLGGYVLVLHAMQLSRASYVVASRELSIVLSVIVGRLWLGERPGRVRAVGAAAIVAGVLALALAR